MAIILCAAKFKHLWVWFAACAQVSRLAFYIDGKLLLLSAYVVRNYLRFRSNRLVVSGGNMIVFEGTASGS
jgi:hypothetical protein